MLDARFRVIDRLPVPSLAALSRTWPDVLAAIARELPPLPQGDAVRAWDWERPKEIDHIIRQQPVGPERRTA
jgi:hypothetical protein